MEREGNTSGDGEAGGLRPDTGGDLRRRNTQSPPPPPPGLHVQPQPR